MNTLLQRSFFAILLYLFIVKVLLTSVYSVKESDDDNIKRLHEYGSKKKNSVTSKYN